MKLKRFNQFVAESKVNEGSATAIVEESAFLVDGKVYIIGEVELDLDVNYDSPEPEVGLYGGHYAESWSIYGIDGVYVVTDPEIVNKIEEINNETGELSTMGFDLDKQTQIDNLIWDADSEEVTGPELIALEKRIKELDKAGQLVDLTGNFEKRCDDAVESAMQDYEPDEPDYDYDDDRW